MSAASSRRWPHGRARLDRGRHASYAAITAIVADPLLDAPRRARWWIAFGVALPLSLVMLVAHRLAVHSRASASGASTRTVVWGFAIANYVWWIGIGNGGTLISSLLLLTRQDWRASINRFAESDDAVRRGDRRPVPDPASRPALVLLLARALPEHDGAVAAVAQRPGLGFLGDLSYLLFSILFWYSGLIPDLATMRDRARSARGRSCSTACFALGWRGSARHWQRHDILYRTHGGARRAAGGLGAQRSSASTSPRA